MRTILSLLSFLFLTACVGTVQDSSQVLTKSNTIPDVPLVFAGVAQVTPISDTRVEVFFYPASGGNGKFTYEIVVGNSPFPISIPSDVLAPDYRGLLRYTVSGLSRLTAYQIKVEVREEGKETVSKSGIIKTATTFDRQVADFDGISSVTNMPGQDGKDSVKIRWTPARTSGLLVKPDWEPKLYEVIVVDAEKLTPGDMDMNYTPSQGRWVYQFNHDDSINEYVIRGLPSKTRFYIRMRCLHWTSIEDVYDLSRRSELNSRYTVISTLSDSLADINFQSDSFAVNLSPGEQGLTAMSTSWTTASGVFDHFRVYYGIEGSGVSSGVFPDLCLSPLVSGPGETIFCKKADFNSTATPITGLEPYTSYEAILVLCQTSACGPLERIISPPRTIRTDPAFPIFNGLRSITSPTSIGDLSSLFLQIDPPNFTQGFFDGLIIKMRRTLDGSDPEVEVTPMSTISYEPYDFLTSTEVRLRGIDILSPEPYCFTIYPFKWDTDGVTRREQPNGVWKCIQPIIEAPTAQQFTGLETGTNEADRVTLVWQPPTLGVFAQYEIFYNKPGVKFNWGDAIAQAANNFNYTNYGRQLVDGDTNTITIDGLADGEYTFGIITYYNYVTDTGIVTLRSETNSGTLKCVVNNASLDTFDCVSL